MEFLQLICENVQRGSANKVRESVQAALDYGIPPQDILQKGLVAGMDIIGEKLKNNEVFIPDVLLASRAMSKGMDALRPSLLLEFNISVGTVVLGTVKGDLHDIGKGLVRTMMECKGLNVIDVGVDVPPEVFVKSAIENHADIIACSALLSTTRDEIYNVVAAVKAAGIRNKVKIMVGGGPVTQEFCEAVGADCYTANATDAAESAINLCRMSRV